MNVAIDTTSAISHGFTPGLAAVFGVRGIAKDFSPFQKTDFFA
jgi:hypothetical protein